MLRRSAAEALANHPEEGYPALEEGSAMDDLMVRRSVVFGLLRVNQPWAIQILDKLQLEDKEWIVRNAANQAMEELKRPNAFIPHPLPPLTEAPWLVTFASKLGMGVAPGKPAVDLVLQALKNGDEDQRLAALDYLRLHANAENVHNIYHLYFGEVEEMREAAFNALWVVAAAGVSLPSPRNLAWGNNESKHRSE
jgi:HEAT repeat protein